MWWLRWVIKHISAGVLPFLLLLEITEDEQAIGWVSNSFVSGMSTLQRYSIDFSIQERPYWSKNPVV